MGNDNFGVGREMQNSHGNNQDEILGAFKAAHQGSSNEPGIGYAKIFTRDEEIDSSRKYRLGLILDKSLPGLSCAVEMDNLDKAADIVRLLQNAIEASKNMREEHLKAQKNGERYHWSFDLDKLYENSKNHTYKPYYIKQMPSSKSNLGCAEFFTSDVEIVSSRQYRLGRILENLSPGLSCAVEMDNLDRAAEIVRLLQDSIEKSKNMREEHLKAQKNGERYQWPFDLDKLYEKSKNLTYTPYYIERNL